MDRWIYYWLDNMPMYHESGRKLNLLLNRQYANISWEWWKGSCLMVNMSWGQWKFNCFIFNVSWFGVRVSRMVCFVGYLQWLLLQWPIPHQSWSTLGWLWNRKWCQLLDCEEFMEWVVGRWRIYSYDPQWQPFWNLCDSFISILSCQGSYNFYIIWWKVNSLFLLYICAIL